MVVAAAVAVNIAAAAGIVTKSGVQLDRGPGSPGLAFSPPSSIDDAPKALFYWHEQPSTEEFALSRPFSPRSYQSREPLHRRNGKIRAREVRVIDDQKQQLGVMSLTAALELATPSNSFAMT